MNCIIIILCNMKLKPIHTYTDWSPLCLLVRPYYSSNLSLSPSYVFFSSNFAITLLSREFIFKKKLCFFIIHKFTVRDFHDFPSRHFLARTHRNKNCVLDLFLNRWHNEYFSS